MGDTIYVPVKRVWFDTPLICIEDLFPGKTLQECNEIMIQAGIQMERFLEGHGQMGLGVQWRNILERDENPDGRFGRFRLYPKYPTPR